jgi:hypothetical protein
MNKDNNILRIIQKAIKKEVKLNPIIPIEYIREFEQRTGVILPDELVSFYTMIGNGGIMIDGFRLKSFEDLDIDLNRVKEEFVLDSYLTWEDEEDKVSFKDVFKGYIELIDIGDAMTWNIIINGVERGKMWYFTEVGVSPCYPSRDFLSWYEYWMDGNDNYFEGFES